MPLLSPPAIAAPAPPRAPDLVMVDAPGPIADVVTFDPGEIECDGQAVAQSGVVRPFATTVTRYGATPEPIANSAYRFTFAIDATGRPHLIRRQETPRSVGYYLDSSDLAPSLAASRFPADAARRRCSITYRATTARSHRHRSPLCTSWRAAPSRVRCRESCSSG